jgi:hypothetical protein
MYAFQNTNPQSFYEKSQQAKNRAMSAYSSYDRGQKSEGEAEQNVPKTIGGGANAAAGGAIAGMALGSKIGSIGGPWGAGIGAAIGGLLYWLS